MAGIRTITASAVTLTENDRCVEADCTNNAITLTLQDLTTAVDSDPIPRTITKIDSSANAVTVTAGSGETINGSSSIYLRKQYETVLLIKGELEWVVAARWDGTSTDEGVAAITATATLTPSQTAVFASGSAGAVTITLADPSATKGVPIKIVVTDATNPITVQDNGSETISGESSYVLVSKYDYICVISNGTAYYLYSKGNLEGDSFDLDLDVETITLDSISASLYDVIQWDIWVSNSAGTDIMYNRVFAATNGASVSYGTWGTNGISTDCETVTFSCDVSGGNTRLRATSTTTNMKVRGKRKVIF